MLLIDTNIAIHFRDGDEKLIDRLMGQDNDLAISLLTLVELHGGVSKSSALAVSRRKGLAGLLAAVTVVSFDEAVVDIYARLIERIGFSRPRIIDRLIAATAIVHDLTLITINAADFRDIPGLKLEVWPAPAQ